MRKLFGLGRSGKTRETVKRKRAKRKTAKRKRRVSEVTRLLRRIRDPVSYTHLTLPTILLV